MLTKLLPYLRPHLWNIGWVLLQVLLIACFELLKPWPLQIVIDNVLGNRPFPIVNLSSSRAALLLLACTAIVFVQFGAGALTLLHNYTAIRIGQNMVNDLRGALYAHLQRSSLTFHGRQRVGDLLYRITADSFAVQTMIMNGALPDFVSPGSACRRSHRSLSARSCSDHARADRRSDSVCPDLAIQP